MARTVTIFYTHYIGQEGGVIETFTSKTKAQKHQNELQRDYDLHKQHLEDDTYETCGCNGGIDQIFDGPESSEFPMTKLGLALALEQGAEIVFK